MMKYKGYIAAVEFDDSIEMLHGRIVNSGPYPIATFQATDSRELRREFERSVDEYLRWCEEDGVAPRQPFSGKLNVRMGSELHAHVAAAATADRMSINTWIVLALRRAAGITRGSTVPPQPGTSRRHSRRFPAGGGGPE